MELKSRPRQLFKPHPVMGWSLTPNSQVYVPFRDSILQTISADGWRTVPEASNSSELNLAVYGCSFIYGTGLSDHETLTANLQRELPGIKVLNRGVGGYGTVQNYLQFREDIKNNAVDCAVFAIISDHRFRNASHPQRMKQHLGRDWYELGIEHVPKVVHARDGKLKIKYVSIWQPSAARQDFDVFLPDDFMLDMATTTVLSSILTLAHKNKIPTKFVILDRLDMDFNRLIMNEFPETMDISTPFDKDHIFLPVDIHPNVHANALFASRLTPEISKICAAELDRRR